MRMSTTPTERQPSAAGYLFAPHSTDFGCPSDHEIIDALLLQRGQLSGPGAIATCNRRRGMKRRRGHAINYQLPVSIR